MMLKLEAGGLLMFDGGAKVDQPVRCSERN